MAAVERAIIGTVLGYPNLAPVLLEALRVDHFYTQANVKIWDALVYLFSESGAVSYELLLSTLDCRKQREAVGGEPYLAALFDQATPVTHILAAHVRAVKMDYQRRCFQAGAQRLQRIATEAAHANLNETLQSLRDTTSAMITDEEPAPGSRPNGYDIPKATTYVLETIQAAVEADAPTALATGLHSLDEMTSGFHPGELVVLAARPGAGKTALSMSMALHAATNGASVLFFSLEMPLEQLWYRALSQHTGTQLRLFRSPKALEPRDWEQVHTGVAELNETQLVFDATATLTVEEIALRCRTRKTNHGLDLVVVDYMQLIHVPGETFREQAVAHISRSLKRLALELGVPVIALSQLNRAVEHRTNRAPILSDLRESGAIEQDADTVVFVHRPALWDQDADGADAELIIAKQRNGPTGRVDVQFKQETTKFTAEPMPWGGGYAPTAREMGRQGDPEF